MQLHRTSCAITGFYGMIAGMLSPIFVRALTPGERQQLAAGLRSQEVFTFRRCQILLASARGQPPRTIVQNLGGSVQTVRNVIHAFHTHGMDCLHEQSSRPKSGHPVLEAEQREQLRALLHQSPRVFGKGTSLWTLALAAEACYEQGLTAHPISQETVRRALQELGTRWQRAKHWITSPDPQYARKKSGEIA
jgi:transposase